MKYYTRNFHNSYKVYGIVDEFKVYEEARTYDEIFYNRLKEERIRELDTIGFSSSIYSWDYTSLAMILLTLLPTWVRVDDIRYILLYAMSPELHRTITELDEEQRKSRKIYMDGLDEEYKIIQILMPKKYLDLYRIEWHDSVVSVTEHENNHITLHIRCAHSSSYILEFQATDKAYKEKEYDISITLFTEILYDDSTLILNILTYTNEYSFRMKDIVIKEIPRSY